MLLERIISTSLSRWPMLALAASLAMLAAAHAFEKFGNMPPCALCLHQREAYWAAVAVSLLALAAGFEHEGIQLAVNVCVWCRRFDCRLSRRR
jgi:disulfide bond formation protein DsbB